MTINQHISAIAAFAQEYVNDPNARTVERNRIIEDAAKAVLGETLSTCESCHINAVLQIYKLSKMDQSKYRMRAGATLILEVFSRADLTMTIHNLTEDLAELHLGLKPHEIKYFDEFPKNEDGEFVGVTAERLAELKEKFGVEIVYPTEVKTTLQPEQVGQVEQVEDVEDVEDVETFEETELPQEEKPKRGRPSKN